MALRALKLHGLSAATTDRGHLMCAPLLQRHFYRGINCFLAQLRAGCIRIEGTAKWGASTSFSARMSGSWRQEVSKKPVQGPSTAWQASRPLESPHRPSTTNDVLQLPFDMPILEDGHTTAGGQF
jgi:hypothetical protein